MVREAGDVDVVGEMCLVMSRDVCGGMIALVRSLW
jgi:hypothetical protein